MFSCCCTPEGVNGLPDPNSATDIDVLGAAPQFTKSFKSTAFSASPGGTKSFRSVEEETVETWTYDPSECSSFSPIDALASPESLREETPASSPCTIRSEGRKVVLCDSIVKSLNQLADAVARATPRDQLNAELATLVAPFVQQVANTHRCSEREAIRAINCLLIDSGFMEVEFVRQRSDGPVMHQARPAAGDDVVDNFSEEEEDEEVEVLAESERSMRMQRLRCFLASNGFRSVNAPKSAGIGPLGRHLTYPLHAAVKANDCRIVEALLWAGSDPTKRDSQRLTPLEYGYRLNRSGSHGAVVDTLAQAMATPRRLPAPVVASATCGA
mmetsp:Transcript_16678/g.42416  ORF Transcript_16678/g.42416 Transcript_16678/m.42416 type:complete len:328 (+) Transcript_16678:55-1038(+)